VGHALPHALALCILSEIGKNLNKITLANDLAAFLKSLNTELEHHEKIAKLIILSEEWTVDNGILTPTLKIKRNMIEGKYQGHYLGWSNRGDIVIYND
jgi:long-chain acyl-CoA synthetase